MMIKKIQVSKKYSRFQKNIPGCKKIFQVVRILLTWKIHLFPGYSLEIKTLAECKRKRKCSESPYARLLTHRVLKADYRCSPGATRGP